MVMKLTYRYVPHLIAVIFVSTFPFGPEELGYVLPGHKKNLLRDLVVMRNPTLTVFDPPITQWHCLAGREVLVGRHQRMVVCPSNWHRYEMYMGGPLMTSMTCNESA
jgi:hypothetical protein